jgi:DinB superfamily
MEQIPGTEMSIAPLDPRYPIGPFVAPAVITLADRSAWLHQIRVLPVEFRAAAEAADLDRHYREGGWTGRQLVHHVPDSHMNSYIRFKLALTEPTPTIKPYDEARWAELADTARADVHVSLALLENLHIRWVHLLEAMNEAEWQRKFRHPEIGEIDLSYALGLYAWHGRHHVAHLGLIRK